ncbi:catechol 2,3-dioxygenase-like lactoylglutathione lyase family enzyme [Mycolicibacterium sp. BK556]|uniref:VOC family protein n=1 Tax=Mycobacteriaceae TaxID=1762 RepID=UPI00105D7628|nr:VOC family protein [Mycobacterium sp. BK086]MBB3602522.1 catechol 2,3-dioxygenase-like lactoylglutathione lyase family enzyme [Mycolicibacterium sp. BK556]MBB3632274.1 catechol 2,3-dioxygenase-like lactoylglutathione lyase family enzyme [Mycolicibacterium sp. BK607]MBB3750295.1 catechol 2,3-dioxygenase-like lactoylglutathione lyase family enzyme [Mycolicibacterium sp. BK634]TDO18435.1 glyoxalase/bleomycin resistance protein/dioxygenase superfamily protein [Mycobacterium sp. BK086]
MPGPVLPGVVRQIGYIVHDFDAALENLLALGIGPFYVLRGIEQTGIYRGEPCTVTLTLGLANSGDMQIEVIHQDNDAPSIYSEFTSAGGDGFHQLAYWAEDYDAALAAGEAAGWPVVWSGGEPGTARYAYFEPPAGIGATIIELMELTPATIGMGELVRSAAVNWDGSDPIRSLFG